MAHYRYPAKACEICGVEFQPTASRVRTCSVPCGGMLRRTGYYKSGRYLCRVFFPNCRQCGRFFTTVWGKQVYCSAECIKRASDLSRSRRRVRRRATVSETYSVAEIAQRDRFRCGLCGSKVRMEIAFPDTRAATIDHVVPISQGGDDTRANVQLAHFGCNASKRDRGSQQLALIG